MDAIWHAVKEKIRRAVWDFKFRKEPPCLIFLMDGGIASQMYQYVCGQVLAERGYKVKYDCLFYEDDGMDLLQKNPRSFALNKLCEVSDMEIASREQIDYYKRYYLNKENQPPHPASMPLDENWKAPLYLGNYYICQLDMYTAYFRKYIHLKSPEQVLDEENMRVFREIQKTQSVGIHIRRGDMMLSVTNWKFPTLDYFVNVIHSPEMQNKMFYIFSDDTGWVKNVLLPAVPKIQYRLMDFNGPERAHMDFYLLCHCKAQVASQGSFGIVTFVVNPNPGKLLMAPDSGCGNTRETLQGENVIYWTLDGKRASEAKKSAEIRP